MATAYTIRKGRYLDSVFLMQVAQRISGQPGVRQVAALMTTEKNKELLADIGFIQTDLVTAAADDLVVALIGDDAAVLDEILSDLERWLVRPASPSGTVRVRTLDEALARQPRSNLAVISVPGAYAAAEARRALQRGLNVFLFSSNVSVEDEVSLKREARRRGLIVMGPDCGTAMIGGVGLGFANAVRRGPIGVVAAMGSGLQEFTCLVHDAGSGISHALGLGGRDLSDKVGGLSAMATLEALEADEATRVVAVLSKPPGEATRRALAERLRQARKPVVLCFLGLSPGETDLGRGLTVARTLDEAAAVAVKLAGEANGGDTLRGESVDLEPEAKQRLAAERKHLAPKQRYLRGLFSGGSLSYQAQQILRDGGWQIYTNAPMIGTFPLSDAWHSRGNSLVDMGSEEFTDGRPHPMIDATLRRERMLAEADDPEVGALLLDFVLGSNASPDPAGDLVEAIRQARRKVEARGGYLPVIASVCGTEDDPQDVRRQAEKLRETGAVVLSSGAQAAAFCRDLLAAHQGG